MNQVVPIEPYYDGWSSFFRQVFKLNLPSQENIKIPQTDKEFNWSVIIPQGLTIEKIISSYEDVCPVWRWTNDNIDTNTRSVRTADNGPYLVRLRAGIEPEDNYKNTTAKYIEKSNIKGMTLMERLLLGRFDNWVSKEHLDLVNLTRCDGTRDFRGYVPAVYFDTRDGKLYVFRHDDEECEERLRTREVRA